MANKFAFGLVLSGAVAAVGITITQKIQEHAYYSTPAPMTSREFEKATVDAMEINRQMFAQQKAEDEKREQAMSTTKEEPKKTAQTETDRLGDWAVRAYEAEQAHEDKCWDQMESRGYGDPNCYY